MLNWLRKRLSLNRRTLTLAVIVAVTAMFSYQIDVLDQFELRTYDLRFRARGPRPTASAVVMAMVDEEGLDREGRWPWPRAKIADLVDRLSADGAKVIAFDIGFLEPDENSQLELLDELESALDGLGTENPKLARFLEQARYRADNDRRLGDSIRASRAPVVLGYFFHMAGPSREHSMAATEAAEQLRRINDSKYSLVVYRGGESGLEVVPRAYAPEGNIAVLTEAATASGFFSVQQDADGVVRWMPMIIAAGDALFPPLSVLAAWYYLDQPSLLVHVGPYGVEGIELGGRYVPTDESGRLLINYLGPPRTFPHVSISAVLAGEVAAGTFRDKVVLVGADATGIYDTRTTPFSSIHPGAEIHASVIDNLVSGRFVTRPGWSEVYDVFAIVVLSGIVGLGLWWLSAVPSVFFVSGLFVIHVWVARELFVRYGIWLNVVYPLVALTATYMLITVYEIVTEQRERRRLRGAFSQYVAPVVVEEIVKNPSRLKLGGEERVLTVLFSDLKGFTSYSERYTPQEMIELLSEYYARMTERVFACGGTLKEYVGDEMMAIFGAPIDQEDHAARACRAALEMRVARREMSEEWSERGRPKLQARTGINTGLMLVGNLGSKYRFSYGVLGDNVNLGSRLEGLNKEYATEILIGENTADLVAKDFILREVDVVRVVGKEKPTRLYELIATADAQLPSDQARVLEAYASALAAYRDQRWDDALRGFGQVLECRPADGPSLVMTERARGYVASPPAADWDGVFVATRK